MAVGLGDEEGAVVPGEDGAQRLQEGGTVGAGGLFKVRQHPGEAPVAALAPHLPDQGPGVPDDAAVLVPQDHEPALGPGQQVLAGEMAVPAHPVGYMGRPVGVPEGLPQVLRRSG